MVEVAKYLEMKQARWKFTMADLFVILLLCWFAESYQAGVANSRAVNSAGEQGSSAFEYVLYPDVSS